MYAWGKKIMWACFSSSLFFSYPEVGNHHGNSHSATAHCTLTAWLEVDVSEVLSFLYRVAWQILLPMFNWGTVLLVMASRWWQKSPSCSCPSVRPLHLLQCTFFSLILSYDLYQENRDMIPLGPCLHGFYLIMQDSMVGGNTQLLMSLLFSALFAGTLIPKSPSITWSHLLDLKFP